MAPSDDPADYVVDSAVEYQLQLSEPVWVVPSNALPPQTPTDVSNNNVDIIFHQDRLFMAWRTSERHWASENTVMYVVSSTDSGASWHYEHVIGLGADVREPRFLSLNGRLWLHYFEGGSDVLAFDPKHIWRIERSGVASWSAPAEVGAPGEVPWSIKVRGGKAFMTSYVGNHYSSGESRIDVLFKTSTDGITWNPVAGDGVVYVGGVSEVAFEFDLTGALWAVTRNEDGDASGFGSHLCYAPASNLGAWECPAVSNPERYDSPWMFRHGDDIYLVARRDVGGPYDQGLVDLPPGERKQRYLVDYWNRPKRSALYRIDPQARSVVHLMDIPGAGDTAFPSVRQTSAHTFLVANYTSPLSDPDRSWLTAQGAEDGTQIYLATITLTPRP